MAHHDPKRKQRKRQTAIIVEKGNLPRDRILNAILIGIIIFTLVGSYLTYLKFGERIGALSVAIALTQGLIHSPSTYAAYAIATVIPLFLWADAIVASIVIWVQFFVYIRDLMNRFGL